MPLIPKVKVVQTSSAFIQVADATGDYDPISNPGGWGTPNAPRSGLIGILTAVTPLSQPEGTSSRLSGSDQVSYIYQSGVSLSPVPAGRDGVYTIDIRLGFAGPTVISATPGSYQFQMTGASTVFATADGFTVDAINPTTYFQIDRTKPLTTTGGWVTTPLPLITTQATTVFIACTINALVSEAGLACLNKDIANFAGSCDCADQDLNGLLCRYAEYLSMNNKFNIYGDFAGANAIARKLQNDCTLVGICSPQGLQPNVPFIGNLPVITLQPVNQSVAIGAEVAFSVAATGTPPLYYQWYRNGIVLPGEVGSTLTVLNAQPSDTATFYVVVSNAYGSATSNEVTLVVGTATVPVTITQQPTTQNGTIGGTVSFAVAATGTGPITYQWYKGGAPIPNGINASLVLTNIQQADIVNYYCIVSGPNNNVQSNTVTISLGIGVGWGWSANPPASLADLQNSQGQGTIPTGNALVADFRTNPNPLILFAWEPVSEPAKTKWYGDQNNNGSIGDPNNDLFVFTIIGSFRAYYSIFPTLQTGTKIQFLTANQQPS